MRSRTANTVSYVGSQPRSINAARHASANASTAGASRHSCVRRKSSPSSRRTSIPVGRYRVTQESSRSPFLTRHNYDGVNGWFLPHGIRKVQQQTVSCRWRPLVHGGGFCRMLERHGLAAADLPARPRRCHRRASGGDALALSSRGERNPHGGPAGESSPYVLVGLLRCGVCGGSMEVVSRKSGSRRVHAYRCYKARRQGVSVCTNTMPVRMADADDAVLDVVESTLMNPRVVERALALAETEILRDGTARSRETLAAELARGPCDAEELRRRLSEAAARARAADAAHAAATHRREAHVHAEAEWRLRVRRERNCSTATRWGGT